MKSLAQYSYPLILILLLVIFIAAVFYIISPNHSFPDIAIRCNKVNGKVEVWQLKNHSWKEVKTQSEN